MLKKIVFNSDDFGYSKGINRGIIESIEKGVITSASVMVNKIAATEARMLNKYKNISIGLHLDLIEENYLKKLGKILYILTWPKKRINEHFNRQLDRFVTIVGRLPDHIDSHFHIHKITGFRHVVMEFSKKYNIPVRSIDASFQLGFCRRFFFNQTNPSRRTAQKLISKINKLPAGKHEIVFHPGYVDNQLIKSGTNYLYQREAEIKVLTSKTIQDFIKKNKNIKLISWKKIHH